jgi:hypothetical protein
MGCLMVLGIDYHTFIFLNVGYVENIVSFRTTPSQHL